MSDLYALAQADAAALILDLGQETTLRRLSDLPDVLPYEPGSPIETDHEISGVWLSYDQRSIDGTLIQEGDQKVLISALEVEEPALRDVLIRGEERWQIVSSKPLKPGAVAILYELQVRQR